MKQCEEWKNKAGKLTARICVEESSRVQLLESDWQAQSLQDECKRKEDMI
jgi:hypothetical protein